MSRTVYIVAGILGVLVGMGFVMPAVALMRDAGALPNESVGLLLLGLTLTLSGVASGYAALRAHSQRVQ
jgi:hypothetical protein